ncbi:glycosyltransferase family 2 protein [Gilvimarinus sp. DA14]|uniref:glycosyltransferase family 2 protein n=1 Tax=Gilvimarinus sp. DA14 TaxID=2956798 RepID=UPI0020B804D0|nr:glycosyltransferase family 2 protein [Gilvimarinus sp. DA14]UTF61927.1 glycosyltransferase family 2 protein [Gilvimarinus sp. DA14]
MNDILSSVASPSCADVIVPMYKGCDSTVKCVQSVLATLPVDSQLILVNDASPELGLTEHIERWRLDKRITLIENQQNLGFVASVNRGMSTTNNDVVLLNSDTEVSADWLSRLQRAAYQETEVATVTPFSNNATVCSYPSLSGDGVMLKGMGVNELHSVCALVNSGVTAELPTAVGFCMYIRRDCLNEVGDFDEEAFGKGYGEENDFCLRASQKGWKHLLAADCFVYHDGGVSFSEQKQGLVANAEKVIAERYPSYFSDVKKFIQRDPIRPFRDRIDAEIFRRGGGAATALWALRAQEYRSRSN